MDVHKTSVHLRGSVKKSKGYGALLVRDMFKYRVEIFSVSSIMTTSSVYCLGTTSGYSILVHMSFYVGIYCTYIQNMYMQSVETSTFSGGMSAWFVWLTCNIIASQTPSPWIEDVGYSIIVGMSLLKIGMSILSFTSHMRMISHVRRGMLERLVCDSVAIVPIYTCVLDTSDPMEFIARVVIFCAELWQMKALTMHFYSSKPEELKIAWRAAFMHTQVYLYVPPQFSWIIFLVERFIRKRSVSIPPQRTGFITPIRYQPIYYEQQTLSSGLFKALGDILYTPSRNVNQDEQPEDLSDASINTNKSENDEKNEFEDGDVSSSSETGESCSSESSSDEEGDDCGDDCDGADNCDGGERRGGEGAWRKDVEGDETIKSGAGHIIAKEDPCAGNCAIKSRECGVIVPDPNDPFLDGNEPHVRRSEEKNSMPKYAIQDEERNPKESHIVTIEPQSSVLSISTGMLLLQSNQDEHAMAGEKGQKKGDTQQNEGMLYTDEISSASEYESDEKEAGRIVRNGMGLDDKRSSRNRKSYRHLQGLGAKPAPQNKLQINRQHLSKEPARKHVLRISRK